ncbi:Uncharacterised protein [Vibrio cholerae]|nr:Uncharacterised protein [Vibrio cholerae]
MWCSFTGLCVVCGGIFPAKWPKCGVCPLLIRDCCCGIDWFGTEKDPLSWCQRELNHGYAGL